MVRFTSSMAVVAAIGVSLAGCHRAAPAAEPVPSRASTDDGGRAARARADSIARAEAAKREADARTAARADSVRRAADALRQAEAAAHAQLVAPVYFDFDRAEIRMSERATLDRKAVILAANRMIRIRIDGNTDDRGSDEYNLALGMRRASEARRYLVDRGIDSTRIALASNGEERPVCRDEDESCRARNRRAEFTIVAGGERIVTAR
jgi:peptidoglycan-associated lipoprotein